uniref:Uncharacterized protein n=1 Tax=Ditylenchus dipsaci TaxID=166011 RepID=A0A915EL86_9BILA
MLLWLSGSLPWKQFEDSPAKVFELKKSFVENAAIEVPKLLKSKKEASLIIKFYKFVGEMEYGELIDFPNLLESL